VLGEVQYVHFPGPLEQFHDLSRALCNQFIQTRSFLPVKRQE